MDLSIRPARGYLRVEIRGRESAGQGREVGEALFGALREHGLRRVLVLVRDSRPLFKVREYDLDGLLAQVEGLQLRAALVADTPELHASHQYVEFLAGQKGLDLRAFRDEHTALAWLLASPAAAP